MGEGGEKRRRTKEDVPDTRLARLLVREELLVRLKTREADRHLRDDAGEHRAEALVQRERRFPPHNARARRDEPAWLRLRVRVVSSSADRHRLGRKTYPWRAAGLRQLHPDLDRVERLAHELAAASVISQRARGVHADSPLRIRRPCPRQ